MTKLIKVFYLLCSCKRVIEKSNQENLDLPNKSGNPENNHSSFKALLLMSHSWRDFAAGALQIVLSKVLRFK